MHHKFTTGKGLTEEIVRKISEKKNEPQWMLEYRLKALEVFNSKPVPTWGPDLSDLDINDIVHYLEPDAKVMSDNLILILMFFPCPCFANSHVSFWTDK